MFYDASAKAPLPYDPLKAIVSPRPIGWVSSMSARGEFNLAPYSFFNLISDRPGIVIFSSDTEKDSVAFIKETGEFTCNLATFDLREKMLRTSERVPRGQSEFVHANLEMEPSRLVKPPRVKGVGAALECKLLRAFEIEDLEGKETDRHAVMGQVVGVYIDDRFIKDGKLDTAALKPIARCGYFDYAVVDKVFQMRASDHPGLRGAEHQRLTSGESHGR
jgi:flavin reductase (DIM6/NTAB) family NADH-FMN oxidoreductase RutF